MPIGWGEDHRFEFVVGMGAFNNQIVLS